MIRSEWKIQNGMLTLNVAVPPNTTATVYLPTQDPKSIKEGNAPLSRAQGARRLRDETGRCVLEVQPGQYTFEAKL
jgi:alpha-L-rhamnosidase